MTSSPRARSFARSLVGMFTSCAALAVTQACTASSAAERTDPATLMFTATTDRLAAPTSADAGYVQLAFENATDSLMAHEVVRIRDSVSTDSAIRAVRILHGMEAGDPMAALAAFDAFVGGAVFVAPRATKSVGVALTPGRYVTYADVVGGGPPRVHDGFVTSFDVRQGGRPLQLPKADHVVRMLDFGFESPDTVRAGRQTWRVENAGKTVHLAFIARVLPGRTFEEAKQSILTPSGPRMVEDEAKMLGVHALSPGVANDAALDLAAGDYVIVCFIAGHHMMGMVRQLTVAP